MPTLEARALFTLLRITRRVLLLAVVRWGRRPMAHLSVWVPCCVRACSLTRSNLKKKREASLMASSARHQSAEQALTGTANARCPQRGTRMDRWAVERLDRLSRSRLSTRARPPAPAPGAPPHPDAMAGTIMEAAPGRARSPAMPIIQPAVPRAPPTTASGEPWARPEAPRCPPGQRPAQDAASTDTSTDPRLRPPAPFFLDRVCVCAMRLRARARDLPVLTCRHFYLSG